MVFLGEYELRIDHKGRLAIPAKFRDGFQQGLVISQGFDKCLFIYTMIEWKKLAEKLAALPVTQLNSRRAARFIFSGAFDLQLDRQGRIVLPSALRQYAEISDEVIVAGIYSHLQVWSRELWDSEKRFMADHASDIAEAIEK